MGCCAIVDYGVGNLQSVSNALSYLGIQAEITGEAQRLRRADSIILPGVGAFPDAAQRLQATGLDRVLVEESAHKPILGICLGMQLLFDRGTEGRDCPGLGFVSGSVERIQTDLKLPHIGWNALRFTQPSPLMAGIDEGSYVYFVHSYCGCAQKPEQVIATTDYGPSVVAAVQAGNVFGTQFHPEKSGEVGLTILRNFGGLTR
jgi:glutamine amidotransferase